MLECCPWCELPVNMHDPDSFGMREVVEKDANNPLAHLVLPPRIPLDVWFPGLKKYPD